MIFSQEATEWQVHHGNASIARTLRGEMQGTAEWIATLEAANGGEDAALVFSEKRARSELRAESHEREETRNVRNRNGDPPKRQKKKRCYKLQNPYFI